MKNIIKHKILLGLASVALLFTACTETLDTQPQDRVVPEFDNIEDFDLVLTGVYSAMTSANYYGSNIIMLSSWASDDLKISAQNNGQGAFIHNWEYAANDQNLDANWQSIYQVINRANVILSQIDALEVSAEEEALKNDIKGEALAIRSLAHLDLYRIYGQRYSENGSLAVSYMTSPDIDQLPARQNAQEFLNNVEADLLEARDLLSDDGDLFRVSVAMVDATLTRLAIWEENWADAITYGEQAKSTAPALVSGQDYADMFNPAEADGENIFKIALVSGLRANIGDNFWVPSIESAYFNPTQELFSLFDSSDVRLTVNFGIKGGQDVVNKYEGTVSSPGIADAKVLRTSEIYLNLAEAYYNNNNEAEARNHLDAVRAARIDGYVSLGESGQALYDAIKTERRKELAFEGFRFYDIKRWGDDILRGDCTAVDCEMTADEFQMIYPIPQSEIFANPNMQQNEGYE